MVVDKETFSTSRKSKPDAVELKEGQKLQKYTIKKPFEVETSRIHTVYEVEDDKGKLFVAKVEKETAVQPVLRVEVYILEQMGKADGQHFARVIDKGQAIGVKYLILPAPFKSLRELRKEVGGRLTLSCGLSVGMQCLKALEELHKVGFIHRDVQPCNFYVSSADKRKVIVFDFGYCHQYRDARGLLLKPREKPWQYMGSLRHMPRNAYAGKELSRADDLEMWFYMLVELLKGCLPWMNYRDPKDVHTSQLEVRRPGVRLLEFLGGLPKEFLDMMKIVDRLGYYDDPPYGELYGLMSNAIFLFGNEFPHDWEKEPAAPAAAPAAAAPTEKPPAKA